MISLKDHLDKLEAFLVMADAGSVRKASATLGRSQPALSRQIQLLEDALETPLFERTSRGIQLTGSGKKLKEFSQRLMHQVDELEAQIHSPKQIGPTHIRIGTFESLSIRLWPNLIIRVRDRFPGIRVGVTTGDTEDLFRWLLEGQLDLAMMCVQAKVPNDLVKVDAFRDSYQVYASPEFMAETPRQPLSNQEAGNLPIALVRTARCRTGDTIMDLLEKMDLRFHTIFEVDTFEAAANYAREGAAIAILPGIIAMPSVRKHKLAPLALKTVPREGFGPHTMALLYRRGKISRNLVSALHKELVRWYGELSVRADVCLESQNS